MVCPANFSSQGKVKKYEIYMRRLPLVMENQKAPPNDGLP